MRLANNIAAMQSALKLRKSDALTLKSNERLSSGSKINSAKDDPAALSIANKLKNQVNGIEMANRNSLDAVSMIQTAEGSLSTMHNIVNRMRELAVQSANDTNTSDDRQKMQTEIDSLVEEIDAISNKAEFNGIKLLRPVVDKANGETEHILKVQVGQNHLMDMDVGLVRIDSVELGLDNLDYTTRTGASDALGYCDQAISKISEMRAKFGSYVNRLNLTSENLDTFSLNAQTSLSRIMDTDMAKEMTLYTKNNLLVQSATSILAQANQRPQQILQLLN